MKNFLSVAFLSFPCIAFAGTQISEGNVAQESCGFPDHNINDSWQLIKTPDHVTTVKSPDHVTTVKNKLLPIGKTISFGDALFYARIISVPAPAPEKKQVYWRFPSNIDFEGKGFFDSNVTLPSGTKLPEFGIFSSTKTNPKLSYRLLVQGINRMGDTALVAIRNDGYFCSGLLTLSETGALANHEYTIYQKEPLEQHVELEAGEPREPSKTIRDSAFALTLVKLDDVSATIELKELQGGHVIGHKEFGLDAMSGTFQISDMEISFEKINKNSIKIKSFVEPTDYSDWRAGLTKIW